MRPLAQHDLDQLSITAPARVACCLGEIVIVPANPEHGTTVTPPFSLQSLASAIADNAL